MAVHRLECGKQALAPLPVETADGAAQLMNGLGEFRAFGAAGRLAGFQLRQFLRRD